MRKEIHKNIGHLAVSAVAVSFAAVVIVCSAGSAFAAGGGDHHAAASFATLTWPIINFSLYATVMFMAYRKKGATALRQQRAELKERRDQGRAELSAAERELEALQAQRDDIENEKQRVLVQLKEEGVRLAQSIVAQAQANAEYSKGDVERRIAGERSKLEADLRKEVVQAATSMARSSMPEVLNAERDARLRREALSQFKS